MPSVLGQNIFIMEKHNVAGENCTFICTLCGDGFSQYQNLLTHMSIHGPLESFTFDGSSNGFEVPREYVLQENGTLTVLTGFARSTQYITRRPSSPGILPSHYSNPANTLFPSEKSLSKDDAASKQRGSHGEHYYCEVCSRTFNSLQFLHRHQQYRTLDGGYRCTLCCRFFKGRLELKKHMQNHTYERLYCCTHCGKRFIKPDALNGHMNQNHSCSKEINDELENGDSFRSERSYTCKKCELTFFWLSDFQIHSVHLCKGREVSVALEVVSRVNLKTCNGTSNHARTGIKKMAKVSSEIDSTYRCGLCGERFPELTALKEHHTTHESQERKKSLTEKSKLVKKPTAKGNRKIRKSILNVKMYRCKLCRCVFQHSRSLSQHMSFHKGAIPLLNKLEIVSPENKNNPLKEETSTRKNYKCHKCWKSFGVLCVYKSHLRHHKNNTKVVQGFTNASSKEEKQCQEESGKLETALSEESVLAEGHSEKAVEDGVFSTPEDKKNSPEPDYVCTQCSCTFESMDLLVQHQITHTSENML